MEHSRLRDFQRLVALYHGLPTVIAFVLVGALLAGIILTGSIVIAGSFAVIPVCFLLWRWIRAGKQIDHEGCPHCGERFPNARYWSYPPSKCPRCMQTIR
jgi:hypothetical protein